MTSDERGPDAGLKPLGRNRGREGPRLFRALWHAHPIRFAQGRTGRVFSPQHGRERPCHKIRQNSSGGAAEFSPWRELWDKRPTTFDPAPEGRKNFHLRYALSALPGLTGIQRQPQSHGSRAWAKFFRPSGPLDKDH